MATSIRRMTAAVAPVAQTQNTPNDDYVPAEFWANIGYWGEIDGAPIFISLTKGVPLDTGMLKHMRGNSPLARAKNALNDDVQALAFSMEPAQAEDVLELTVQIRRAAGPDESEIPAEYAPPKLTFAKRG